MGNKRYLQRLATAVELPTEPLPGMPLVEIAGDCRVLVERHMGVIAYDNGQICVKVSFGQICVCGCDLELVQMTKAQLVIMGKIYSVTMQRRK